MNTIYVEKIPDMTWGKGTNINALEILLQNNKIVLTPDKVERMPEDYINERKHSTVRKNTEPESRS